MVFHLLLLGGHNGHLRGVNSPLTGNLHVLGGNNMFVVINGLNGHNLSKKNSRIAAENSAMRWRQTLRALDIPVYVMNSLTGEIVYEAV